MNTMLPTVMLVEGTSPQCNFLRVALRDGTLFNESGEMLPDLNSLAQQSPDAVILDIGMPDHESWTFVQGVSESFPGPVIIITNQAADANGSAQDSERLARHAKPLAAAEYQAMKRVSQRFAKTTPPQSPIYQIDDLRVDLEERTVTLQGKEVRLTPSEFRLLTLMIQNAGKVLTHAFLLEAVWGADRTDDIQSLRVYMSSLRRKIEVNPVEPRYLLTIQGIGYRLRKA